MIEPLTAPVAIWPNSRQRGGSLPHARRPPNGTRVCSCDTDSSDKTASGRRDLKCFRGRLPVRQQRVQFRSPAATRSCTAVSRCPAPRSRAVPACLSLGIRKGQVRRVLDVVACQARHEQCGARVFSPNRNTGDQSAIAIDVAPIDADALIEEQNSRRPGCGAAEWLATFGGIDAMEPDANRLLGAQRHRVDGIAVDDRYDSGLEARPNAGANLC